MAESLPPGAAEPMKLDPAPERTVADLVRHFPVALEVGGRYREVLRRVARERYDWASVTRTLAAELRAMT